MTEVVKMEWNIYSLPICRLSVQEMNLTEKELPYYKIWS